MRGGGCIDINRDPQACLQNVAAWPEKQSVTENRLWSRRVTRVWPPSHSSVLSRLHGESHPDCLKNRHEGLQCGIASGGQCAIERLSTNARLGSNGTESSVRFSDSAKRKKTSGAIIRVIQRLHRRLEILDSEIAIGSQLGYFARMV